MSKTLHSIAFSRCANPDHPAVRSVLIVTTGTLFGILKLDHWDLFEFWILVLGIFMISTKLFYFEKSLNAQQGSGVHYTSCI